MVPRPILAKCLSSVVLVLGLGCAFTTETIHIEYQAPLTAERVKGAEGIRVKVEVVDLRAVRTREVAKKINGFGMEAAPIYNDEDVPALVKRAVEAELRARGYSLENGKVPLQVELVTFLHRYNTGFFSGDSQADVTLLVRIRDAQGHEVYTDTSSDTFKHSAMVFDGGNVKDSYEQALPGAIRKAMGKPAFHAALAKVASAD